MKNILKRDLEKKIGNLHASQLFDYINSKSNVISKNPEIALENIHRFNSYFTSSPGDNIPGVIGSLLVIALVAPICIDEISHKYGKYLFELTDYLTGQDLVNLKKLIELTKTSFSGQEKIIFDIARSIVTLKRPLILVTGAGLSYDSMPITHELLPLLISCLKQAGVDNPKKLIEEDNEKVWDIIKQNQEVFKTMFQGWSLRSQPSLQHKVIAELIKNERIAISFSFNWDDLIERAYQELTNEELAVAVKDGDSGALWKYHGDCRDTSTNWVFPYENGYVFDKTHDYLEDVIKSKQPQFCIIIGYSEQECEVQKKLISPLESGVEKCIRIRPGISPSATSLDLNAKTFFKLLKICINLEEEKIKG